MPELQPQTSSGGRDSATSLPAGQDDALSRLARMSTTAGVGSGDYVAINTLAIASTLLGLGSMIVPLLGPYLLQIIPLAAIVTALVAWRQIKRSNGTQTGRGLAAAGILLALLFGGGTLAAKGVTAWKYAPETPRLRQSSRNWGASSPKPGQRPRHRALNQRQGRRPDPRKTSTARSRWTATTTMHTCCSAISSGPA